MAVCTSSPSARAPICAKEIAAAMAMAADADIVEHRKRAEQREILEGAGDADVGNPVWRLIQDGAAGEANVAARRCE